MGFLGKFSGKSAKNIARTDYIAGNIMKMMMDCLFHSYLLATNQRRCVTDLMPMIGARFYTQLDALQSQCDLQEDELAKEMENGRLYRILVKINCINERPE